MKIEGILYTQQSDLILNPTWFAATLVALPLIACIAQNEMGYTATKRSFNILLYTYLPLAPQLGSYLGKCLSEVWAFKKLSPAVFPCITGSLLQAGAIYQAALPTKTWWPVAIISSLAAQILIAKHEIPPQRVLTYQRWVNRKIKPIQSLILKVAPITLVASLAISIANSH